MVSVVKLNPQEYWTFTMIRFMKVRSQEHRALELGLITVYVTKLGPKKS